MKVLKKLVLLSLVICFYSQYSFGQKCLSSECYGCVCEIFDVWWPDDAPNCFKKEISKITKKKDAAKNIKVLPQMTEAATGATLENTTGEEMTVEAQTQDPAVSECISKDEECPNSVPDQVQSEP